MSSTELRTAGFYECKEGSGLHLDPEYIFSEILDPDTKEPVPPGKPGIFVWSHIDWRGTAILRYWSGDYIEGGMVVDPCPHCLLSLPRLRTPIWRAEKDFTKIRGTRVEFVSLQDAVRGVQDVATFQIILTKEIESDPFSRDRVEVLVAAVEGNDTGAIQANIKKAVLSAAEIGIDSVRFDSAAEIEARLFAKKLKAEWIVDSRPQSVAPTAPTGEKG
jgi:phenylacetate-CoA ligase